MTRRRWTILIVAFAAAIGAFIAFMLSEPPEPSFQGRRLSEWVQDISPTSLTRGPATVMWVTGPPPRMLMNRGRQVVAVTGVTPTNFPMMVRGPFGPTIQYPPQHTTAAEAIRAMGTNAVPHLLRTIYTQDGKLKTSLLRWWRKQSLVKVPVQTAVEKQQHALPALAELGPAAVWTWVEILTNDLASAAAQRYAAGRLADMREGATPVLAALLLMQNHPEPTARISIRHAIQHCERDGFLSALYNLRHSGDQDSRASAAWSLGFIGKNPDMSVPALAAALKDESAHVRESAVEALGKFGTNAPAATNLILRAMNDPHRRVRKAATNALARIVVPSESITAGAP